MINTGGQRRRARLPILILSGREPLQSLKGGKKKGVDTTSLKERK